MKISGKNWKSYLLGGYLGLAPIYWLPLISSDLLLFIKLSLFALILAGFILDVFASKKIVFPGGAFLLFLMTIFFVLTLVGFYKGNLEESFYALQTTALIFVFVICSSNVINKESPLLVIKTSVILFSIFSFISLVLMYFSPDMGNPLNDQLSIRQTGFGGSRNSWSPAISLFVPYAIESSLFARTFLAVSFISLFANQIMVVGRSGILATFSTIALRIFSRGGLLRSIIASLFILAFIYLVLQNLEYFRLTGDVSDFSTGRNIVLADALNSIGDNFFSGVGFGNRTSYDSTVIVHVELVRLVFENGIFYGLVALLIILYGLSIGWKKYKVSSGIYKSAFLCLVAGVVVSFFEPYVIFGNFFTSSLWWFSFCVVISKDRSQQSIISKKIN